MTKRKKTAKKQSGVRKVLGILGALLGLAASLALLWFVWGLAREQFFPDGRKEEAPAVQTAEPEESAAPEPAGEQTLAATSEPTPEPTPEPTAEPVHYTIPEDANAGPAPDEACYGTVSMDEPEALLPVIQEARDRGLLGEDEVVAFDPNVSFYRGIHSRDIEYYLDDSILVILWKEEVDGLCCTFTEIKIADPSQFRRKLADDTYNAPNQYFATEMARQTNAVVAMNADYYRFRDVGIVAWNRELYRMKMGTYTGQYKLYNCVDTLFIDGNGDFVYLRMGEENNEESVRQFMEENDLLFSVAFGPVIVEDGEPVPCDWYPVGEVNQGYSRAGIGQMGPCHYLYMSLNHGDRSARWTVTQFAEHFAEKPVITAYCVDGGQTGEVVFRNEAYSYMDFGEERQVSDILYFVTAIPEDARDGG